MDLSTAITKTGLVVAADFRDKSSTATIQCSSKLMHLCSETSEDAVTWNVYRSRVQGPVSRLPVSTEPLTAAAVGWRWPCTMPDGRAG
jgi:hypothetical protein